VDKSKQDIFKEKRIKNSGESKISTIAADMEQKEISSSTSSHKEPPSESNTALSGETIRNNKSNRSFPRGRKKEGKMDEEEGKISILSPTDAVFETETQPQEVSPFKKRKGSPEKKSFSHSRQKVGKFPKESIREKKTSDERPRSERKNPQPAELTSRPVSMSKGVAYLRGNLIKLIGGVKLSPGDEIRIKDRQFVLKAWKRRKTPVYLSFLLLIAVGLIFFSPLFKPGDAGKLLGIVIDEETGKSLPGAEVYLREKGEVVTSDDLGFFIFESLPVGSYTLEVSSRGYSSKGQNLTISRDKITTVSVRLSSLSSGSGSQMGSSPMGASKTSSSDVSISGSNYGAIRVKSNVSDPVVMIDNRPAGRGNGIYRKIKPGIHQIRITREGYQEWSKKVKIKPGKVLNLKIHLPEDESYRSASLGWRDYVILGKTQLSSNDFASALNSYNQALSLKPDSPDALLGRGYTYLQIGENMKALEDLKKAAQLFFDNHDYSNAAVCYTSLIVLNDQDKELYLNRGICYLKSGEYRKSIEDLRKAVKLDKSLFPGYLNLGEAYYKAGEYKLSIKAYKHARKLKSKSPEVFAGLTKVYFAKGDKSRAKKYYQKFKELSTYIEREKMKRDPEWREVMAGIGVASSSQP